MQAQEQPHQPLAYSIAEFQRLSGLGSRTSVYREIALGRLRTVKCGRRRLVPYEAAKDWLDALRKGGE